LPINAADARAAAAATAAPPQLPPAAPESLPLPRAPAAPAAIALVRAGSVIRKGRERVGAGGLRAELPFGVLALGVLE